MTPILLIEDGPLIAGLYRTVLAEREYDVITALNKRSAGGKKKNHCRGIDPSAMEVPRLPLCSDQ